MKLHWPDQTPFERGEASRRRGEPSPGPVTPSSSWESRLFRRGWWHADAALQQDATVR